jgi:hypothetical protein
MEAFRIVLYALAILTSGLCTILLFRGYARRRFRLLLWSALCFAALTINNVLLFIDLIVLPGIDMRVARLTASLIGVALILFAFIWESD